MPSRTDYLPTRIADLIEWAVAFLRNATLLKEDIGLSDQALSDLSTTVDRAKASVDAASDPLTRTRISIERQREDLATLKRSLRSLVKQVQAFPQTTDDQRRQLDITVPDRTRTERPTPTEEPVVTITQTQRHMVAIKIRREDGRAGKPAGISGMNVYYAVSDTVPTHIGGWTHAGQATRMGHVIAMPTDVPAGATIWITANYYNGRGEVGPLADAISTNLPGGQARLAA
jgi:hypothetical protein